MGRALRQTAGIWWKNLIDFTILNVLWIGMSFTIVGGPPALAAMYQLAANAAESDYVDWRAYFGAMKRLFFPAWRWGALQLVVYGITGFNLLYYSAASGPLSDTLRVMWGTALAVWTVLNLFYWPFFLQQDDQRLANTYRNVLVLVATQPGLALGAVILSTAIIILCIVTVILFAFAVLPLIALLGTFAVQGALAQHRRRAET